LPFGCHGGEIGGGGWSVIPITKRGPKITHLPFDMGGHYHMANTDKESKNATMSIIVVDPELDTLSMGSLLNICPYQNRLLSIGPCVKDRL